MSVGIAVLARMAAMSGSEVWSARACSVRITALTARMPRSSPSIFRRVMIGSDVIRGLWYVPTLLDDRCARHDRAPIGHSPAVLDDVHAGN